MKINSLTTEEVFHSLVTSEQGLSEEEAVGRLREFGPNEISEVKKKHLIARLFGQFTHFLAVLLWMAAFLSFLSEYLHPGEGMLTLGFAIITVIIINAVFTFIQEYRAEKALDALRKLLPFYVKVIRDSKEKTLHAREVVPGDLILLAEGDKVPADARLIETSGLKVNHAPLTGESEPLRRNHDPFPGEIIDSQNIAFAGTTIVSGSGRAIAFATGMNTEFGRIAHLTSAVESGLSPLQKEIVKATRVVAVIGGLVGLFFFILGFIIGRSFWDNFIFGIGITVALIPEGMLPTVTLALAMGSQRMAKRKALIKKLTSVETLGAVTVICTDKTGTLTQNRMEAVKLWVDDLFIEPATAVAASSSRLLFTTAALCNNARFIDGEYRGDPTETALLRAAREALGDIPGSRLSEIPFDSDRKMMTVVYSSDNGTSAFSKGARERILPLCSHIIINGERRLLDDRLRNVVIQADHELMDMGLRALAFASKELSGSEAIHMPEPEIEQGLTFIGLIGLHDPPRPEAPEAVTKCHDAGIRIIMITGDGSRTATAIAKQIGLVRGTPVIIEGQQFNDMSDSELLKRLGSAEIIFARMTPKNKLRVVSLLKDKGEVVAVTGDGVNDAPALKKADIGISMGIVGTDVAKEASDMVLLDDNFATIVNAVEEGRAVYENIKKFLGYIISSNIPEAVPYLAYILLAIPLPLTILQILIVDLGTDMLPALALGTEKPTPGVMKQPPRKVTERLLNLPLCLRAYLFLGPIEAVACMFAFFWTLWLGGWTWGVMLHHTDHLYLQATTACLTAIIVTQIANVFACRSDRESLFSIGVFTNKFIFVGIAFELLLQLFIVYHPVGNAIFATSPLPLTMWLVLIPFAIALLTAEELRKGIARKMHYG
jgi:sodium/potassium-transporting ATPase subunit alpha